MRALALGIVAFAASVSLAAAQTRAPAPIAPQITSRLWIGSMGVTGPMSAEEIDDFLDHAVTTLAMTKEGAPRWRYVSSCRLWSLALRDGYRPLDDNYNLDREVTYERTCLPLLWLRRAHPSRVSHLPAPDAWIRDAAALRLDRHVNHPNGPLVGWPWGNVTRTFSEAQPETAFQPDEPDPLLGPFGARRTELDASMSSEAPYGEEERWWDAARGDFDHDGFEDALILLSVKGIGNRAVSSNAVILTRRGPRAPVEILFQGEAVLRPHV